MVGGGDTACALAHECDVLWVATEARNVFLDPEECCALISKGIIGFVAGGGQVWGCEKAVGAETVAGVILGEVRWWR